MTKSFYSQNYHNRDRKSSKESFSSGYCTNFEINSNSQAQALPQPNGNQHNQAEYLGVSLQKISHHHESYETCSIKSFKFKSSTKRSSKYEKSSQRSRNLSATSGEESDFNAQSYRHQASSRKRKIRRSQQENHGHKSRKSRKSIRHRSRSSSYNASTTQPTRPQTNTWNQSRYLSYKQRHTNSKKPVATLKNNPYQTSLNMPNNSMILNKNISNPYRKSIQAVNSLPVTQNFNKKQQLKMIRSSMSQISDTSEIFSLALQSSMHEISCSQLDTCYQKRLKKFSIFK